MADVGIYTKNADIVVRAGVNANATAITLAETDKYVLDVEAYINTVTNFNWSDWYVGTPNADFSGILKEAGGCLCAIYVINYDIDAIGRSTATLMINMLYDRATKAIAQLTEADKRGLVQNG